MRSNSDFAILFVEFYARRARLHSRHDIDPCRAAWLRIYFEAGAGHYRHGRRITDASSGA
jgi:hypothetical protein